MPTAVALSATAVAPLPSALAPVPKALLAEPSAVLWSPSASAATVPPASPLASSASSDAVASFSWPRLTASVSSVPAATWMIWRSIASTPTGSCPWWSRAGVPTDTALSRSAYE